jgi:flagella basal body P-ring formation protein FlgA
MEMKIQNAIHENRLKAGEAIAWGNAPGESARNISIALKGRQERDKSSSRPFRAQNHYHQQPGAMPQAIASQPFRLILELMIIGIFFFAPALANDDDLPPPPLPQPPAVNLAVLQSKPGLQPQEIWSDSAPGSIAIPASPAVSLPAEDLPFKDDAKLDAMLDRLGKDATRGSSLEKMLFEQLRAAMPAGSEGYIFEKAALPDNLTLAPTGWKARFDFRLPARGIGTAPFSATITGQDGKILHRLSGSVQIDREAQGVQVGRVVRRGEVMRPADVKVLGARLSQLPRGVFDAVSMVEGTVARQELRPGQWLAEGMVQAPDAVKRGQAVTIQLKRGPIQITAPGVTREAGAMGEVIHVQNAQSRRDICARVISKEEVLVIF